MIYYRAEMAQLVKHLQCKKCEDLGFIPRTHIRDKVHWHTYIITALGVGYRQEHPWDSLPASLTKLVRSEFS